MKTCNKCGKSDLSWNQRHHERTGKWQLSDHKNKEGDWCVRNNKQKSSYITNKKDFIMCELCKDSSFGLCRSQEDYKKHQKIYHPNGEVLTELDWKAAMGINRMTLKNWKSDAHYSHWDKFIQ